jgi:predicted PurR-regulated permease PerM
MDVMRRHEEPDATAASGISSKSLGRPALYALVLLGMYLTYLILSPFLAPLTWAAMFAVLFHGTQVRLAPRIGPSRAALVTTILVGLVIVAPALALISTVARELPQVSAYLKEASQTAPPQLQEAWDGIRTRLPVSLPEDPIELLTTGMQRAVAILAPRAGTYVAGLFAFLGSLFAMLFALFFMLRDGETISRHVRDRLPFSRDESARLMQAARDLVIASIGAGVVVAVVQGTIGGLAFWLVGIPAPAFWGLVISFAALIPVLGAALVWAPASLWLFLSGEIGRAVTLVVVGILGISMADNVLRPILLTGRTNISGLVIFFGLLGGAAAFGFIGLVIGPILLVITARIIETLRVPSQTDMS